MHHVTFTQQFPGVPDVLITYLLELGGEAATRVVVYCTHPDGEVSESVQAELQQLVNGYFSGLRGAVEGVVSSDGLRLG